MMSRAGQVRVSGVALLACVALAVAGTGCAALPGAVMSATVDSTGVLARKSVPRPESDRVLIKSASLTVAVPQVTAAAAAAEGIIKQAGGYVEDSRAYGKTSASVSARIPVAELERVLDEFAGLGRETRRSLSVEDVTAQVIDLDATLRNKKALRDRLRKLLDRTANVKDVLAVEKELTRLQSEIESMEGRVASLRGRAAMSAVSLQLEQRRILGPLGYLFKGGGWLIGKLFVIR